MQNSIEQIADEILVMDAQSGSREAFERLVSRWQKRLWAHAYTMTYRPEAAWDITQESWLNIVRGLGRLNDPAKFGAWAYRIVSHRAHDWLGRNGSPSGSELEEEPPESSASMSEAGQREIAGDVHSVLHRLPGNSRVVLKLYYLEGFGLAEIAEILGTPEGTIKSRLHNARIEFRKHWESLLAISPVPISATVKGKTL